MVRVSAQGVVRDYNDRSGIAEGTKAAMIKCKQWRHYLVGSI